MINLSNASRKHKCIKEHLLQESVCSLRSVYTKSYTTVGSMIKLKHFYAVINYCVTCLSWCNKLKKMNNMCKSSCTHCEDFEKTMTDTLVSLLEFIYSWSYFLAPCAKLSWPTFWAAPLCLPCSVFLFSSELYQFGT